MRKIYLLLFFIGFQPLFAQSVQLSVYSEISIITVGPGEVLYEAFGHSAIRIKDPVLNLDLVYNYGMFDFNAPNFYSNFVKGRLYYKLSRYPFHYFEDSYKRDKRWIKQQVLDLTQQEKNQFFRYLENNALPKNATYSYDPYFNNCATKLRDIATTILGDKFTFNDAYLTEKLSLRQLMDREIPWNTWGSFGINLALGSKLDQIATPDNYMYLPDYVYLAFKNATVFRENQPKSIVKNEKVILNFTEIQQKINFFNPLLIFTILAFIGLFITFKDIKNNRRNKWLDFTLFFITGLLGTLIAFLWFFTNHATTPNNFNFLWAFAPNLFVAFLLLKDQPKKWIVKYLSVLLILLLIIPIIWIGKIQQLPLSIIPILILLFVRYYFLSKRLLTFKK